MDAEKIRQIIHPWASGLNYRVRIYFYGSRLKGNYKPDSDLDLAIEFLDPWQDTTLLWFDYHEQWEGELSKLTNLKVDLELYDLENKNIRAYIKEQSMIIFESPEALENDEVNSLSNPDVLSNIAWFHEKGK